MADKETKLDSSLGGLFLMTIFTAIWTVLAEYFFSNLDYKVVGVVFGGIIIYFIFSYLKFNRLKASLSVTTKINAPKNEKALWIIFGLEGIAIFITKNVLVNTGRDNLFIACIALIVGLHFFPLAKVFERKFYYYIGSWTVIISILGLILIIKKEFDYNFVNAFVCVACAMSTSLLGLKIIKDGNKILVEKN